MSVYFFYFLFFNFQNCVIACFCYFNLFIFIIVSVLFICVKNPLSLYYKAMDCNITLNVHTNV